MQFVLLLFISVIALCNPSIATVPNSQDTSKAIIDLRGPLTHFRQIPYGTSGHGISGSAQYNRQGLGELRTTLPGKTVKIIDLRQESHIHINGVTLYLTNENNTLNAGKTTREIVNIEDRLVIALMNGHIPPLYLKDEHLNGSKRHSFSPTTIEAVYSVMTEAELVATHTYFSYERLPVTDMTKLTDAVIERLVELKLEATANQIWLHCHCAAGMGRTSQALTVWCMMQEAKEKSMDEIFGKLEKLGNKPLLTGEPRRHPRAYWQLFHDYCVAEGWKAAKWSDWRMKKE